MILMKKSTMSASSSRQSNNAAQQPNSATKLVQKDHSTTKLVRKDHSTRRRPDDSSDGDDCGIAPSRGGVQSPFPWKVFDMLENGSVDGIDNVVCWLPHGRAFMVHHVDRFVEHVMVRDTCNPRICPS